MILTIRLTGLRNNEYTQFMQNILSAINRYDPTALQIKPDYDALMTELTSTKQVLNEATGSATTDELVALDTRRDNAFSGALAMVNANTFSTDAAIQAAANLLVKHLENFGPALIKENYPTETSKLQKIVQDWDTKPDLKAAVITLNLTGWKTEIETANTAFDTRYVDRSVATGTAKSDRVYQKRPAITLLYDELILQLDSWYNIKKKTNPEPWATAVDAVNGVIKDYSDMLAVRAGKGGDDTAAPPAA